MPMGVPPIIELAVSVQFSTERPVDTTKLVLHWDRAFRTSYPNVTEVPTLEDVFEKFGAEHKLHRRFMRLQLETLPGIRYQFTNTTKDRMVQLQPTRLILNWMRRESAYPSFSKIHNELQQHLEEWQTFATENNIGEIIPNQWELIYVNMIPQGELWNTPADWHRISKLFVAELSSVEPLELEDRGFHWRMRMSGDIGRIHLTVVQATTEDEKLGMHLTITARGPASNLVEVNTRLQEAHDEILKLFGRIATDEAKAHWGITP